MPTTILPIAAIRALRLTCRHCGSAVVIPISAHQGPLTCFNCARELPGMEVMKLVGELRWLQKYTAAHGAEARFRAETAIPYDCNDVIHEEHVKAAKRKIVEAVFGEFRPFFIQINSELFNRNFERARELIREMEDSMFESSEPE